MPTSRRAFFSTTARALLTSAAAGAFSEAAFASRMAQIIPSFPNDWVVINGNENPLGPAPVALNAVANAARLAGRYSPQFTTEFIKTFAEIHGIPEAAVIAYAGSSDPLLRAVTAYCTSKRGVVAANPTFEAAAEAAQLLGFPVKQVPLAADYSHDVEAMAKADPSAGIIYVCNPNNPTGTLTPRSKIEWLLANKPKGSVVLLDEAYIQFSSAESCVDLINKNADLIILRTFSKLYGMAGLRLGVALGRFELVDKLESLGVSFAPITALAAGTASLKDPHLIKERRQINTEIREMVFNHFERRRYKYIPSVSNKFMADTGRPADVARPQLEKHKVEIARTFPALPHHIRVSIGTRAEMTRFLTAYDAIMSL